MTTMTSGAFTQALDLSKPYRTRDGRRVMNLRRDGAYVRFAIEGDTIA